MRKRLWFGAATAPLLALASQAAAQTAEAAGQTAAVTPAAAAAAAGSAASRSAAVLDELIVTAQKREESVQDIAQTVTAVPAQVIEHAGIRSINDIRLVTTGLNLSRRPDNTVNVTIRGVGSFGNVQGVGFYVDDVQVFSGLTENLLDLQRLEVLKGPQGTLYGGNNIGGAIKYVLKKPEDQFGAEARVEAGSRGYRLGFGAITGPLTDAVKARLTIYGTESDGYMFNTVRNDTIDHKKEYGGRLAVSADLGRYGDLEVSLRASDLDDSGFNIYYRAASPSSFSRTISYDTPNHENRDVIGSVVTYNVDLPAGIKLTAVNGYTRARADYLADADYSAVHFADGRINLFDQSLSQEVRLSSPDEGAFTWIAGVYGLTRQSKSAGVVSVYLPGFTLELPRGGRNTYEQTAAFVTANYRFAEKWKLTAGARLNRASGTAADLFEGGSSKFHNTSVLPRVSLSYDVNPSVMLYGTYAKGIEPGGAVFVSGVFLPSSDETTQNLELGVKAELFDHTLRANAALFRIGYDNRLFENASVIDGVLTKFRQSVGDSVNKGVEVELTWRPIEDLQLTAAGSWVDAEWKDGVTFFDPGLGQVASIAGNQAPYVPFYTATLGFEWRHEFDTGVALRLRGDSSLYGKQYWDVPNHYSQGAYAVVNLGAAVEWKQFELSAQVRNLSDTGFNNDYLADKVLGTNYNIAVRGEPRTWIVGLSAKF